MSEKLLFVLCTQIITYFVNPRQLTYIVLLEILEDYVVYIYIQEDIFLKVFEGWLCEENKFVCTLAC